MNTKTLIGLLLVLVALGLYYFSRSGDGVEMVGYSSDSLQIAFEYRKAPDGYTLDEVQFTQEESGYENLRGAIILLLTEDYESLARGEREGGEGPPALSVFVYDNPQGLSPREWVELYPQLSLRPLIRGTIAEGELSSERAIFYEADGLYASKNVIVTKDNLLYHINGQYLGEDTLTYQDFETWLESISF